MSAKKLDDAEIYRRHSVGQKYPQIMAELGISRGGVHKALTREKARRQQLNGEAPGGVTEATPDCSGLGLSWVTVAVVI
jgi:hypothetical protein